MLRTDAIKNLLCNTAPKDLSILYNHDMECQVIVSQDDGERIDGDYKGKKWHGWSDGITTWKPFRIPWKASTEPVYTDYDIKFDLAEHAEGIGMTGWDWKSRCSKWVAFDFDAIVGHSDKHQGGLPPQELDAVVDAATKIDWVTVRKSTSGNGLHLYVFLDDVETQNHNEHAALARSILGMMSAITGFDFHSRVDICGGNMWVWHKKMVGTDGLSLIKQGEKLYDVPKNWKDHVKVVKGTRRKNLPHDIQEKCSLDTFEKLTSQRTEQSLNDSHKKLIEYLRENDCTWWWDQDHHMLVCHTFDLKSAHKDLSMKGIFDTTSKGTERHEQNCFAFPLRSGGWCIRRYTIGVQEHESWSQDGAGWTYIYYNVNPDFSTACRSYGGIEDTNGGFVFREAEVALQAAGSLGVKLNIAKPLLGRRTILKQHKDGRLIIEITHEPEDTADEMKGWLIKKSNWQRIYNMQYSEPIEADTGNFDEILRHLVTVTNDNCGWVINADANWQDNPLTHVKIALSSLGFNNKEVTNVLGNCIFKSWKLVNEPFQPEYPGNREWNRNSAQLSYVPKTDIENLYYPTWQKILTHCGSGLDIAISNNEWCKLNNIKTGADYLMCWVASVFQEPIEPLPYLFFWGPENSGKSIFHEALNLLVTKGYQRADHSLTSGAGFNGELEGSIICVTEEINLRTDKQAYNRIKDWVTSPQLNIRHMYQKPYHSPNTTHWIQCANPHDAAPIFPGDTRITMCHVGELEESIPKKVLIPLLRKEATDFITAVMNLDLPKSPDRLNIPIITTEDKLIVAALSKSPLTLFLEEHCIECDGNVILFNDFYTRFKKTLDTVQDTQWSKIRVGKEIPPQYCKGRSTKNNAVVLGNIGWRADEPTSKTRLCLDGKGILREVL